MQRYMKTLFRILPVLALIGFAIPAYAATPIVESAKITGPNTVTIVYSEPVNTSLNDYGTFS